MDVLSHYDASRRMVDGIGWFVEFTGSFTVIDPLGVGGDWSNHQFKTFVGC